MEIETSNLVHMLIVPNPSLQGRQTITERGVVSVT